MEQAFHADFICDKPKDKSRAHGFPRLNCLSNGLEGLPKLIQFFGGIPGVGDI